MSYGDFSNTQSSGSVFAIRGDLDGGMEAADYSKMRQYIGLLIEKEEFLLPIEVMNEIIMINQMTFVPASPRNIEGVINLRGRILPALNMRRMLGHDTIEPTNASRIVIANHDEDIVGLIVDGITYVVTLTPDQIEDRSLTNGTSAELLSGISKRGETINGILDIAKIISEVASSVPALQKID